MRILTLTNLFPPHYLGGYELICYQVVRGLRARGHEVAILTSDHVVAESRGLEEERGIERTLKIHGLYGHPWLNIGSLRLLEQHNNDVLRRALRLHKPDLVHVWNMGGLSKSLLLTLQSSGLPTVFYSSDHWIARGFTTDVWLRWWNRQDAPVHQRLARWMCEIAGLRKRWDVRAATSAGPEFRFERICFCSRALRQSTVNAGWDVAHGEVIYPPVDISRFNEPPRARSKPVQRLLFVGRLGTDKGVMTALRALSIIREKFPGELTLCGSGEAQFVRELKRFVSEARIGVRFAAATLEEMPQVYRDHDALVFPSEWAEPFALTPLEAMASGLPVIGTTTGGSAELFRDRENALTFPAGNAEALARCILELTGNDELRFQLACAGFEEVRRRFEDRIMIDQVENYLQESLPSKGRLQKRAVGESANERLREDALRTAESRLLQGASEIPS
jgi:glycogen synthase